MERLFKIVANPNAQLDFLVRSGVKIMKLYHQYVPHVCLFVREKEGSLVKSQLIQELCHAALYKTA